MHYILQDTQFQSILKILIQIKYIHTKNIKSIRRFIDAIFYMLKSGIQWRLLPFYYGHWRAIHKRFKYWAKKGVWQKLFQAIQQDPDMEYVMLDSTIIRANACAAGYKKDSQLEECLGRSRGGFTTKIHALTDALGNPLKFILTGGQRNDITQAIPLLNQISDTFVIADKGYDSNELIAFLQNQNCISVIPSRKNRKEPREYDTFLYQDRNRIECFFGKIKQFRRIASRFEKSAQAFLSFLYLVGVLIWIR